MAVGRPIKLTPNVASKTISIIATAGQTSFTPSGGYRVNEVAVYRNGIRLVQGRDFTAIDGATVTLLSAATLDDVVDFQIFDSFNIADALNANGNQTIGGDLTVNGQLKVGTALTISRAGDVNTTGVITATSFEGSGANLTGVSGFATALSSTQTSALNKIFKTPKILEVGAGTSIQIDSDATSGYIAFTREARIEVGIGATFAIGAGTTFIANVLDIF